MNIALWIIQILLGLLFLFAGSMKFVMSVQEMTKQMPMPGAFLHFIGVAEILGGLGLILPSVLRIKPSLTPLAASGLIVIMAGATVIALKLQGAAGLTPAVILLLLAFVAYGRWRLAPLAPRA